MDLGNITCMKILLLLLRGRESVSIDPQLTREVVQREEGRRVLQEKYDCKISY